MAPLATEPSCFLKGIIVFESVVDRFERVNWMSFGDGLTRGFQGGDFLLDSDETFFDFCAAHGRAASDYIGFVAHEKDVK